MLTVTRLGLPRELRRSLACTNIIENFTGTMRRVVRNVKMLALALEDPAMGRRHHAGSSQGFPSIEGIKHLQLSALLLQSKANSRLFDELLVQIAEAA